jgi:predicted PurR-regulated permease PerM
LHSESTRDDRKIRGWFIPFFLTFLLLGALSYSVTRNLLQPLAWSALLSFFVLPVYRFLNNRLLRGRYPSVAATITSTLAFALVLIPAVIIGVVAAREGIRFYGRIADILGSMTPGSTSYISVFVPDVILAKVQPLLDQYPYLKNMVEQVGTWVTSTIAETSKSFLGNAFSIVYNLVVIMVASFFMIRDGHLIVDYLMDIMPLPLREREAFLFRTKQILQGVVFGVVLTAGIQGTLGGMGWWYVGLPSPVLFGAMMAFMALIPLVGTPSVWLPGSLYLLYSGNMKGCIVLLLWGVCVVSMVDNFIRPIFISEGGNVHVLIVFVGALGGLAAWGFLGIFLGPLSISMFVFILDSYRRMWKTYVGEKTPEREAVSTKERRT